MPNLQPHERYNDRFVRVLDFVHAHLDDELSFDRLAEVACLSPYHWSRIYSAMHGETIVATIRRLRLQRAADRLANSSASIDIITSQAGYSAAESFGRAFKQDFGISPVAYRETGSHAAFKRANMASDASGFPVTIEMLPEVRCAGVDHSGSYMAIDHAMGRLFAELAARQSLPSEPAMIGLFLDDPDLVAETALRSRACLPIAETVPIDAPLIETKLFGGRYARLRYTGPYADMRDAYRWLFGVWLPASGYEPNNTPVLEAYLDDPRQVPQSQLRTDILLPLKAAQ